MMCPGASESTMYCSQGIFFTFRKFAMVAGNIIIEEAKIGGITPAVLIFRGKFWKTVTFATQIDDVLYEQPNREMEHA